MYSNVVLGIGHHHFEDALEEYKERKGHTLDTDLSADDWKTLIRRYQAIVEKELGQALPAGSARAALGRDRRRVRLVDERAGEEVPRAARIPASWGTAVNVQAMVFGNMGETSATGVAFTRNPSTGERSSTASS